MARQTPIRPNPTHIMNMFLFSSQMGPISTQQMEFTNMKHPISVLLSNFGGTYFKKGMQQTYTKTCKLKIKPITMSLKP